MVEPMINVEIPRSLYKEAERDARFGERFEDVLRRWIKERADEPEPDEDEAGGTGYLAGLVKAGKLRPGEVVSYELKRKAIVFKATVTAGGSLELPDGRVFKSPSGAANACTGTSNNGWAKWRTAGGSTLDELRTELAEGR